MVYCGPICCFPCGYGYGYGCGPYYGGIGSSGLVPACGIGSLSGVGTGIGSLSGIGGSLSGIGGSLSGIGGSLSGIGGSLSGIGGSGTNVSCTAQTPASEIVIQPPPAVVTIPGPSLSSSNEPVGVSYISPCIGGYPALGSYGGSSLSGLYGGLSGGYGRLGYGGWRGYSRRCLPYVGSCGYGSYGSCGPC